MIKKNQRLPILHEDGDIIVIDKPAGMLAVATDRDSRTAYRAVTDYVRTKHKSNRVWIVHRLDRDTSGVMVFAKSEKVKLALQENWETAAVRREYAAVAEGRVDPPEQRIVSWLKQTKTLVVYSSRTEGDGKLAITNYRVLRQSKRYSLLEVVLETGRKNQIRVHLKEAGFPIVGDKKYGAKTNPLGRLGLHASVLTLVHPTTGEEMTFSAPIPECFRGLCPRTPRRDSATDPA